MVRGIKVVTLAYLCYFTNVLTKLYLSQWHCICANGRCISKGSVLPETLRTKAYFEKYLQRVAELTACTVAAAVR